MILFTVLLYCWLRNLSWWGDGLSTGKKPPWLWWFFCYFISVCGRYPLHPCGRFFPFKRQLRLSYIWWAFGGIHESVSRLWYTMSWCYLKCLLLSLPFLHPEPPLFYYRQSLNSTLCFCFWDLPIGMTIQPITRDAGDRGPLQIYAAGG